MVEDGLSVKDQVSSGRFTLWHGDCVEVLAALPADSVHVTVSSPPYIGLYVYNASDRDVGNVPDDATFWRHFRFIIAELHRVTKPGRIVAIDAMNLPTSKQRDGHIGLKDFRGEIIREFIEAGFIYHSEHCMWKDPLTAATRTKALGLLHKQLCKDSSMSRAGIPQYLIAFRKPGVNAEPIAHERGLTTFYGEDPPTSGVLSHERWRRYASPIWMDIDFTDTLNYRIAKDDADQKHICPFALQIVERALHLWSNPGDVVLDPFSGIGSTGHVALSMGRRFVGVELKDSYFAQAAKNLRAAEIASTEPTLFPESAA